MAETIKESTEPGTVENPKKTAAGGTANLKPFAKGFDPRRGHGKKQDATIQRVNNLARQYTEQVIHELVKIATEGKSESARVAAISIILERGWGKPASNRLDRKLKEKIHRERMEQEMGILKIKHDRAEAGLPNDSMAVQQPMVIPPPRIPPIPEWMKRMGMIEPNFD